MIASDVGFSYLFSLYSRDMRNLYRFLHTFQEYAFQGITLILLNEIPMVMIENFSHNFYIFKNFLYTYSN